jgi:hypothetical protein
MAYLSVANLSWAYLSWADLSEANLSRAYLSEADLPYQIFQAFLGQYHICTNKEYIRIGCQYLTVSEWLKVTKDHAIKMGLNVGYYSDYMDFIRWYSKKPVSKGIL